MDVEKLRELVEAHPDVMDVCQRYAGKNGVHPFADAFASLPGLLDRLEKLERVAEAAESRWGGGGFCMTSGEVRCPECHHPRPKHAGHSDGCKLGAALADLRGDG